MLFYLIIRLMIDCGEVTDLFEAARCQLPTGIAVDAGGIDIKVSGSIGIKPLVSIGHQNTFIACFSRSAARHRYQEAAVR